MRIPFSPPDITDLEIDEVVDTLKSGWITTGPKAKLFERMIADYCSTQKAAAMSSETSCMEMTLRLLGIGKGDEVITTAYTYSASASVIDHVGAKIVMLDTGKNSYEIDYEAIPDAITERTKAIIPVDIAGIMCDYDKIIQAVDSKKGLFRPANKFQESIGRVTVAADAAHSFGATFKGITSGNAADFTSFSFQAVKNMTTAEGGAVTWRELQGITSEEIYKELMIISLHGQTRDALDKTCLGGWEYDIISPAYKCNMTDILASLGIVQLHRYPGMLARRKTLIGKYDEALKNTEVEVLKHFTQEYASSGHLYLVRLTGRDEKYRNEVIEKMAQRGIATNVHFKPLPLLSAYLRMGFKLQNFPNAYQMYRNEITLPLYSTLKDEDAAYVVETFKDILSRN